jgi:hypothetical protein
LSENLMTFLVGLGFMGWWAVGLKRGTMLYWYSRRPMQARDRFWLEKKWWIHREFEPVSFWIHAVLEGAVALVLVVAPIVRWSAGA